MTEQYEHVYGRAAFDADLRDYNGGKIIAVSVAPYKGKKDSDGRTTLVRVTIWPEMGVTEVKQGDRVDAYGKFEIVNKDGKTYLNLSAREVIVTRPNTTPKREVVNQQSQPAADAGSEDDLF